MPTTQSEDPNERIDHPRHYNQHKSGIETIELIEHLPCNLAMAVKYIWRCGLKATETPLRDLKSARWYTNRERERINLFELGKNSSRTEMIWRALAKRVIICEDGNDLSVDPRFLRSRTGCTLADFLHALLRDDFQAMLEVLDDAIARTS